MLFQTCIKKYNLHTNTKFSNSKALMSRTQKDGKCYLQVRREWHTDEVTCQGFYLWLREKPTHESFNISPVTALCYFRWRDVSLHFDNTILHILKYKTVTTGTRKKQLQPVLRLPGRNTLTINVSDEKPLHLLHIWSSAV